MNARHNYQRLASLASLTVVASLVACGGSKSPSPAPPPAPVSTAPSITTHPLSQSVSEGTAVTFSVAATGTAPLQYVWQRNAVPIAGAGASSYTITATLADNGAVFRVAVTNNVGSVTSNSATLAVAPPNITRCTGGGTSGGAFCWAAPSPQGNTLTSVRFRNASTGFATGAAGTVLRTDDGGATWRVLNTLGLPRPIGLARLNAIAFVDANTLVAAGRNGLLLRSTDNGVTWTEVAVPNAATRELRALDFSGSVGVVGGNGGQRWRSTDGGLSWTQVAQASILIHGASSADATRALMVTDGGSVQLSTDGGVTWATRGSAPIEPTFGEPYPLHAVRFVSPTVAVAVGRGGSIVRSTDAGLTWSTVNTAPINAWLNGVSFASATEGYAAGYVPGVNNGDPVQAGVLLRTTDSGATWTAVPGAPIDEISGVAFTSVQDGTLVGTLGRIYRTSDGGATWTDVSRGTRESLSAVAFVAPTTAVASVAAAGLMLRSTDGGVSWTQLATPATQPQRGVAFADANVGVSVGDAGSMLRTTNSGANWSAVASGTSAGLRAIRFFNASTGLAVGEGGTILRTANAGASWQPVASGVTVALNAVTTVGATQATVGTQDGRVLRSGDAGLTWTAVSMPDTDSAVTSIAFADANVGIAAGRRTGGMIVLPECRVWRTVDAGATWSRLPLPACDPLNGPFVDSVAFLSTTAALAVGSGGGVLRTADAGLTWTSVASGTGARLNGVAVSGSLSALVVGDGGVVLQTISGGR